MKKSKKLVSFYIDEDDWEALKKIASDSDNEITASLLVRKAIKAFIRSKK